MIFWCLQFLPKNKQTQIDLRYHKVEFVRLIFGRIVGLVKSIWLCLTFSKIHRFNQDICMSWNKLLIFKNEESQDRNFKSLNWKPDYHVVLEFFVSEQNRNFTSIVGCEFLGEFIPGTLVPRATKAMALTESLRKMKQPRYFSLGQNWVLIISANNT